MAHVKKEKQKKMKSFGVRVPPKVYEAILKLAAREKRGPSTMARILLEEAVGAKQAA